MKPFKLILIFSCILSWNVKSQSFQEFADTVSFDILLHGHSQQQEEQPLILSSDKEYFDFYYNFFGAYPKNFRFDFEKEMIVVIFRTLTSGTYTLGIDYILETGNNLEIVLKQPQKDSWHTHDMNPSYLAFSVKKSGKPIVIH